MSSSLLIELLQLLQRMKVLSVSNGPRGWMSLFPAAVSARRDLQTLSIRGLAQRTPLHGRTYAADQ